MYHTLLQFYITKLVTKFCDLYDGHHTEFYRKHIVHFVHRSQPYVASSRPYFFFAPCIIENIFYDDPWINRMNRTELYQLYTSTRG